MSFFQTADNDEQGDEKQQNINIDARNNIMGFTTTAKDGEDGRDQSGLGDRKFNANGVLEESVRSQQNNRDKKTGQANLEQIRIRDLVGGA